MSRAARISMNLSRTALLLLFSAVVGSCSALNPAVIKGYKFFDSVTKEEIAIRGIDYYPRPNTGIYNLNSVDFFTEEFRQVWERDLANLKNLGVNAIRLYSVDPNQNHDAFMCALNQAGIYAIVALASESYAVSRDHAPACYSSELKRRGQAVVQEFSKYSNTLAFSAGNEVNHFAPNEEPEVNGPCLKKFVRDMREFLHLCSKMRKVPVGLVAADSDRAENALYYNCQGDPTDKFESAEWYGLNTYLSCDSSVEQYSDAEGFVNLQEDFESYHYSIPVVLTEFGCLSKSFATVDGYQGQRAFKQAGWLATEAEPRKQFAGGFVFEYSIEYQNAIGDSPYPFKTLGGQNYGVGYFTPEDCDDVVTPCDFKRLPNYYNLQQAYNQSNPSVLVSMDSFEISKDRLSRTQCPKQFKPLSHFDWKADRARGLSCPTAREDVNFTCPANLEELRGRYNSHGKYDYEERFHFPEGTLFFGGISLLAICLACIISEKEIEAEANDTGWGMVAFPKMLYRHQNPGSYGSNESTGLLSMQDLTNGATASHATYHAVDPDSSIQEP